MEEQKPEPTQASTSFVNKDGNSLKKKSFFARFWWIILIITLLFLCTVGLCGTYFIKEINSQIDLNTNFTEDIENGNASLEGPTQDRINITPITIDASAIQIVEKQTAHCKALSPEDWEFVSNSQATGADLISPDRNFHAGWGISPVMTGDNPPYMFPSVDSFLSYWLGYAFTGQFRSDSITLGTAESIDYGFEMRDFSTTIGRKGTLIYKTYDFGSPAYVVSVYMADTPIDLWDTQGAQALYSAISIRCVTQVRPTTSSVDYASSDASSKSDNPEVNLSEEWTEAIMGYENVYSPTTGEHYEVPLDSYWETGPDGAGYYRGLPGGGYEKLEDGFGYY